MKDHAKHSYRENGYTPREERQHMMIGIFGIPGWTCLCGEWTHGTTRVEDSNAIESFREHVAATRAP